jgi:hypothetical protein
MSSTDTVPAIPGNLSIDTQTNALNVRINSTRTTTSTAECLVHQRPVLRRRPGRPGDTGGYSALTIARSLAGR